MAEIGQDVRKALLKLCKNVAMGTIQVSVDAEYVAVRSESPDAVPYFKWSVLKVDKRGKPAKDELIVNSGEFGLQYLRPNTAVLWLPLAPQELTKVVLTSADSNYIHLSEQRDTILSNLPELVKAGTYIESLGCYVKACEPVDSGLIPQKNTEKFTVSVIESSLSEIHRLASQSTKGFIDVESFFSNDVSHSLELGISPLARPIPTSSIMPPVADFVDKESLAFVKLPQLAKLGIFSGDMVKLESNGASRSVLLYSYPEPNSIADDRIYMSPLLVFNLGMPTSLSITKVSPDKRSFETARDVTLSRISSPASTDKAYQAAFLRGLKHYFGSGQVRVVKNGDLIPVAISSSLARLLGSGSQNTNNSANGNANGNATSREEPEFDILSLHDESPQVDTMIWFEVNGLNNEHEHLINSSQTRIVQTGLVQRAAPPSSLLWQEYWGLPTNFSYLQSPDLFPYAHKLNRLFRACLTKHAKASLRTTVLLKSSKPGAGKSTLLRSLAEGLGIHQMDLDALDLIGDSDGKTLALFKARLERAATSSPCLVSLKHFDTIARKNDVDGKDTPLVNGLVDILDDLLSVGIGSGDGGLIFAASVRDPDLLADSVRNKFKFEIDVTVPTERERRAIIDYLTSSRGGFNNLGQLVPRLKPEIFSGFAIRGDVSIDSLAVQSAGLTPPDLCAIIRSAKHLASSRATNNTVLSSGGYIKLTPQDLEEAIREARDNFSDSIGAPKIPNVGWKDVGGLDMVKGEILDTIDMPLKHPELFSSGLKKRSGILFYGPPGTGKTLLAKAIATNFSLNFFSVKGPELLNMYIGESEANVRRVFQKARDAKPCVVFFDELDSVAPKRGNKGDSGGVMDRIVSQLLAELDGMSEGSDGVFVVGATNRPDLLDEALLRPGRFDKMLYLGISDTHAKQQKILEALTRKFELAEDVRLDEVAEQCPYTYTGADFYALSSDAMLNAMTRTAGEVDAKITKYNEEHTEAPVSIAKWFQVIAQPEEVRAKVSAADFTKALNELVPSVSVDELDHYLKVRDTFEGNVN